ncbi:MAG TPA: glycoside hydrolase [Spirochaetia bacterium]|nr:glycoside hydrolase [Spirochaetia bacterium]
MQRSIIFLGCIFSFIIARNSVDVTQWKGFNLLEKFGKSNKPFLEEDFQLIKELGFNFVRLPIDYRSYVNGDDWYNFNEASLNEIDQAVEWGKKYGIHICINLHRGPGFCINPPAEKLNLWSDDDALQAFCDHWRMFAKRYKGIAPENLTFNLLNEPARARPEQYIKVFSAAIEVIHAIDNKRLIIVDGMDVGKTPYTNFTGLDFVIQSTRGYQPGAISHYRASWVKGSDKMPVPVWPPVPSIPAYFYGPQKVKDGLMGPLELKGNFAAGTVIIYDVNIVSEKSLIIIKADGLEFYRKDFIPKDGKGEWTEVVYMKQYHRFQNVYNKAFSAVLKAAASTLLIENIDGDWMTINSLKLEMPNGVRSEFVTDKTWGQKQITVTIKPDGSLDDIPGFIPEKILDDYIAPWLAIKAQGVNIFVGEWGSYNKTPHDVSLAWMRSWLRRYKENEIGWCLWNFRGPFGILDSERTDVQYEDWHGHKLDRKMLEMLRE